MCVESSELVGENVDKKQYLHFVEYVYAVTLPCDAPVRFDPLDGGVFYVLEGEALLDLGVVHTHADLHRAEPGQGGSGVAHYLRHGPPARDTA